ncbi:RNA polymerase sigma-70 factor, ECF subfamily [Microbulbifer donghaiensis]|uniref:RNA polymerase sigma-70 factor, ECF subfamily n=1 Tax=Microbulbifer donghaiensis TaxID=494016 RepID=A0A1M4UXZ3_9GAMM|nr:RNA polymerase factor sigma-70 [Microbulbifer donghaiensis]SHE61503.1 RNA polymerase sigma-70 factor, ECF subfamily [Microbulbifer donghaiensis]
MSENAAPNAGHTSGLEGSPLSDEQFLQELRQQMHRFASLQLGDPQLAEDAVQEALVGAIKNVRTFAGRAALKTWVFAILKNKIADSLRQRQRFVDADQLLGADREGHDHDELFDRRGHWLKDERPAHWEDPEAAIHDKHFWRVFESCLNYLPARQAQVFMMREFIELESHEICAAAEITVSNLNVTLHRARLRLRECLENNWFGREEG